MNKSNIDYTILYKLNRINQKTDFLFSSSCNGIANQEKEHILEQLRLPEDQLFSDINFFSMGNKLCQFNYDLNNECSIHSFDSIQSSKKSEYEFESFNKKIEENEYEEKRKYADEDFQYLNNNLLPSLLKKEEYFEPPMERFPITSFGDYNKLLNNPKEKEFEKNENENELTNQNSGIFYAIQNRKINKIKGGIKFLVIPNKKKSLNDSKTKAIKNKKRYKIIEDNENLEKNEDKNTEIQTKRISKKFSEKILIKKYKYKCEHPGCTKTFKTLKLKLNRHDLSNSNCKKDTLTLFYMIKNTKDIIKRIKRKNKARIRRFKKLYKKCIFILPHKEYAINIVGDNLIN